MKTNEITGKEPNEKWTNLGFFMAVVGVLSLLGINVTGVEIVTGGAEYMPLFVIFLGVVFLYYGTQLKRNQQIANRNHELELEEKRESK